MSADGYVGSDTVVTAPFAFCLEMTEAVTNIGPFKINPGSANTVQTSNSNRR